MALQMLTNVSIAFVYREANFRSETVSQSHLGENLEVLNQTEEWLRVRQEDGYEGWISKSFVAKKPQRWNDYHYFSSAHQVTWVYQSPDQQSTTLRDMTTLSALPVLEHEQGWVKVLLPDEKQGWVEDYPRFPVTSVDIENLIQTAFSFLGIQYFWGGRSPKGFDCSGFTQTTYGLNGFQLPRDAHQQAEIGVEVHCDFMEWQVGDLIFFAERSSGITHVAISLGQGDFIHASGYIKINSINPAHKDLYIEKYAGIVTKTMRVL